MEFIETYPYIIRYKQGKENIVTDAFSQMCILINSKSAKLLGFEHTKELYENDLDFFDAYKSCAKGAVDKFFRLEGYLFRENELCISNCSMRELLVLLQGLYTPLSTPSEPRVDILMDFVLGLLGLRKNQIRYLRW
ncbi:uncharacterized protein LOC111412600 [Olea europaea var. sylvestris]|uniref:uncharacterized protein LOC111412600 n=1 Tax=Olea europaea var. sylvestris TaxID=158386 RepID=UPI000C1CEA3E|nr:uncharacterized protein LOC111412600 [Olea europaea var. sylvestris]